jgi:iron complex transport system substrate-binding protein
MRRLPSMLTLGLGLALGLAVFSGCNAPPEMGGNTSRMPPDGYPMSIVSLSPSTTEIVAESGNPLILKGRTAYCNYPKKAEVAAIISDGAKPNYEKITEALQRKPALIVYDDLLYTEDDIEKMKQTGAEVMALGGDTIEEYIADLYKFAKRVGSEASVAKYVENIRQRQKAAALAPAKPTPRVAILMPGDGGEHMIVGVNSFQADVVRAAAAEPVGPDADRFVPLSAETLVQMNPDVIFVTGNAEAILNDPRFKTVAAVQKGNVAVVKPDILLRRGWRVDKLILAMQNYLTEGRNK